MKSITIQNIHLHPIAVPYKTPFRTSFGVEPYKAAVIVEMETKEGVVGWGECSVETKPGYGPETVDIAMHLLENFLVPRLLDQTISDPTEVPALLASARGGHHTKHGLETAVWDAFAKVNELRLVDLFQQYLPDGHQTREVARVGVSIGIQETFEKTIEVIQDRLDAGYNRIKLKIQPGWDVEMASTVRQEFPDISLMLDANSAYSLKDADHLKQLDELNLLMIEQPLAYYDIYEHGKLQAQLTTPVCLDESVKSLNDFQIGVQVGACSILNLKPARVGGFTESIQIYKFAVENEIPLWIGGMLETGIGRAANVAFASFPGITLPCDISATERYFHEDISEPPFVLNADSTLTVPGGLGIGVDVHKDRIQKASQHWFDHYPYKN